jgi:hypothetical protein
MVGNLILTKFLPAFEKVRDRLLLHLHETISRQNWSGLFSKINVIKLKQMGYSTTNLNVFTFSVLSKYPPKTIISTPNCVFMTFRNDWTYWPANFVAILLKWKSEKAWILSRSYALLLDI